MPAVQSAKMETILKDLFEKIKMNYPIFDFVETISAA